MAWPVVKHVGEKGDNPVLLGLSPSRATPWCMEKIPRKVNTINSAINHSQASKSGKCFITFLWGQVVVVRMLSICCKHSTSVDLILLLTSHFSNLDHFPTPLSITSSTSPIEKFAVVSHRCLTNQQNVFLFFIFQDPCFLRVRP